MKKSIKSVTNHDEVQTNLTILQNQYYIQEKFRNRLNSGGAYYHLVQSRIHTLKSTLAAEWVPVLHSGDPGFISRLADRLI